MPTQKQSQRTQQVPISEMARVAAEEQNRTNSMVQRNRERRAQMDKASADKEKADDLLDEIDELLDETLGEEETAENFVRNYVQKGGQ